jgi:hypothetical protein
LLEDGIIVKSDSPWNSPLLVVPKKTGPDGERKWRMVVDFHKLNEKLLGMPTPYWTLPKYWTSWANPSISRASTW